MGIVFVEYFATLFIFQRKGMRQAVQVLREEDQRVSLAAISRKTKEIDPDEQGVSESAVPLSKTKPPSNPRRGTRVVYVLVATIPSSEGAWQSHFSDIADID
jgi:hypothetical protein